MTAEQLERCQTDRYRTAYRLLAHTIAGRRVLEEQDADGPYGDDLDTALIFAEHVDRIVQAACDRGPVGVVALVDDLVGLIVETTDGATLAAMIERARVRSFVDGDDLEAAIRKGVN